MKKFVIKTSLLTIVLIGWIVFEVCTTSIHPSNYLQGYNLKCELLEKTKSPRIIFVGGSNLAFGLDSQRIRDSLHMNVINCGLHAGVGLKFMIDDISTYVQEGDIIVIAPEYNHFYESSQDVVTLTFLQAVSHWQKIHLLDFDQILKILHGVPSVVNYVYPSSSATGVYSYSSFNEYGDVTGHWKLEGICDSIKSPNPFKHTFDKKLGRYFIKKVMEMEKKSTVIIIPPVCRETAYMVMQGNAQEISNFLSQNNHPFNVSPIRHVLPDKFAYDTDYHMNYEGVKRFTSLVIDELKHLRRP